MVARYKEIDRVSAEHEGLRVDLKLQSRLDQPPMPYYCLSWRTRYASNPSKSRRFYSSADAGFWVIPVPVALSLLRQADGRCMLSFRHDDLRLRDGSRWNTIIDSRQLNPSQLQSIRNEIICSTGDLEWGKSPQFLISQDEGVGWAWREIMIVDTKAESCTFRCTTTSTDYKMGIFADRLTGGWRLDNALQDASAASMREFLRVLEDITS